MRRKCEHRANNAAEILACVRNVSTMLTMRYAWGAHISVNSVATGKIACNETTLDNILIMAH